MCITLCNVYARSKKKEENWTNWKSDGREDEKVPDVRQEWVTHILDTISLLPHNFSLIVSMVRCWQVFSRRWRELTSFSSEYVYIDVYGWLNVVMHLKHWLTWISSLAEFINHINCYFGRTIRNYEWGRRQQLANLRNWNHYHKNVHSLLPRPIRLTQKKKSQGVCVKCSSFSLDVMTHTSWNDYAFWHTAPTTMLPPTENISQFINKMNDIWWLGS